MSRNGKITHDESDEMITKQKVLQFLKRKLKKMFCIYAIYPFVRKTVFCQSNNLDQKHLTIESIVINYIASQQLQIKKKECLKKRA